MAATPLSVFTGVVASSELVTEKPFAGGTFGGGNGSASTPYIIEDVLDLQNMSANLNAYYTLGNDINASETRTWNGGQGFMPVGISSDFFNGILLGGNHSISGLFINRTTNEIGLFGFTNGKIENVHLKDVNITGLDYTGGLVGDNRGKISNCSVSGIIHGGGCVGGLAGSTWTIITNSSADAEVFGTNYVGGLVGYNQQTTILRCMSTGNVKGLNDVGGLVGRNVMSATISDSYSTGNVNGTNNIGGLVGFFQGPIAGQATNCYSTGLVQGITTGGFVCDAGPGIFTNCFWDNQTSGQTTSAGGAGVMGRTTAQMLTQATFVGWDFANTWWMVDGETRPFLRMEYDTEITNSHQLQMMAMDLTADYTLANDIDLGDIVVPSQMWGTNLSQGKGFYPIGNSTYRFQGSFDGGDNSIKSLFIVRPTEENIGLFGYADSGILIDNLILENVNITGMNFVGALIGQHENGIVNNCHMLGDTTGESRVGGLIGAKYSGAIVKNCTTSANVRCTPNHNSGGLIGYSSGGMVDNCTSNGSVLGDGMYNGGLIGYNTDSGVISNSYAYGDTVGNGMYTGGLVGYNTNSGMITNSTSHCNVTGNADYTGGLVGYNVATVSNSSASGYVSGTGDYVGGLVGGNFGSLSNSHAYGDITGANIYSGGLAGYNTAGFTIFNCSAHGNITGTNNYCGGLVGRNVGKVENCSAYGNAGDVASWTGSLVGDNFNGAIVSNCSAYGNATGMTYVGGLAGNNAGAILNSSSSGVVAGGNDVGGLVGYSSGTVNNTTSSSVVGGQGYVGGLVGFNSGSVSYSSATGAVTSTSFRTGGLIGGNEGGGISYCYATGRVNGTAIAGGLVGYYGDAGASLTTSFATGNVTGTMNLIGGFVGYQFNMPISNCYARGNVVGSTSLGGFAGGERGDITNCYSTGTVTGNPDFGGFRGVQISGTLSDCHWDIESSGTTDGVGDQEPDPSGLFGNTTAEMKQQATFTNWDFANIWGIYETNSYPFLKALYIPPEPQADLEINLTDLPDPVTVGNTLTYMGSLTNRGPDNALDVYVNITLPLEVTFLNTSGTMNVNGRYITGNPGFVASGASLNVFINVTVDSFGSGVLNCTTFVTSTTLDPGVYPNATYQLTSLNRPPVAVNDSYQTTEDYVLTYWGPCVLSNDFDPDTDLFTIISHEDSDFGAAIEVFTNGSLSYDPTVSNTLQALHGAVSVYDTFNYTISDGRGGTATATITIQVDGQEGWPTAVNDTFTVTEDSVANVFNVLPNDILDEEGDTITISSVSTPWQGTATITGGGTGISFTPRANYYGVFDFNYWLSDGHGVTDIGNVNVTVTGVNDAPHIGTIVNDETAMENESYIWNYSADDLVDGDPITWSLVTNATWLSINATGVLSGTPPFGSAGAYSVNLTVSDGHGGADWLEFMLTVLADTDGDGTPNSSDNDDDGDGVPDGSDDLPLDPDETTDTDDDGIGNNADTDDDGDGIPDAEDSDPLDPDVGNDDTDGDGVVNSEDDFPNDPAASVDTDGDGNPDDWNTGYTAADSTTGLELDEDDDGDGIPDAEDENPLVPDDDTGGNNMMLYLIIIIIVVVVVVLAAIMLRPKGPKPEPAWQEPPPPPPKP